MNKQDLESLLEKDTADLYLEFREATPEMADKFKTSLLEDMTIIENEISLRKSALSDTITIDSINNNITEYDRELDRYMKMNDELQGKITRENDKTAKLSLIGSSCDVIAKIREYDVKLKNALDESQNYKAGLERLRVELDNLKSRSSSLEKIYELFLNARGDNTDESISILSEEEEKSIEEIDIIGEMDDEKEKKEEESAPVILVDKNQCILRKSDGKLLKIISNEQLTSYNLLNGTDGFLAFDNRKLKMFDLLPTKYNVGCNETFSNGPVNILHLSKDYLNIDYSELSNLDRFSILFELLATLRNARMSHGMIYVPSDPYSIPGAVDRLKYTKVPRKRAYELNENTIVCASEKRIIISDISNCKFGKIEEKEPYLYKDDISLFCDLLVRIPIPNVTYKLLYLRTTKDSVSFLDVMTKLAIHWEWRDLDDSLL